MSNEPPVSLLDACRACEKASAAIIVATEPTAIHWSNLGVARYLALLAIRSVDEPKGDDAQKGAVGDGTCSKTDLARVVACTEEQHEQ